MSRIGQYLLLDRIAAGGMAEVYRAKSFGVEGFEKIIAIKRILPELAEDDEFITMFVEEAKIAGQLSHANIVPIYELGKIGDTHFIAMEYVWGKDLRQIVARFQRMQRRMPPPMAAWIAARVLEGLDYAHRKRGADGRPLALIHRDVSPQNVLVSYDGLVKLIDFGIAKAASRATQTQAGVVKGKLGYMSPEQMMGRPLDHRSDVFAASTCLHEMLGGQRLFAGATDIEVVDKVRRAEAPPPSTLHPDVPEELDRIVLKGLAREPDERYPTAGAMQEELMRFVALSRPPFGTARLAEWMRTAFAPEIAREKEHLDRLTAVSAPGEAVSDDAAPSPAELDGLDDEDTVVMAAPSEQMERSSAVELSQVVIVEEVVRDADAPGASPAAPSGPASGTADAAPAGPTAAPDAARPSDPAAGRSGAADFGPGGAPDAARPSDPAAGRSGAADFGPGGAPTASSVGGAPGAPPAASSGAAPGAPPAASPGAAPGAPPAASPVGAAPGAPPAASPGAAPGAPPAASPGAAPGAPPAASSASPTGAIPAPSATGAAGAPPVGRTPTAGAPAPAAPSTAPAGAWTGASSAGPAAPAAPLGAAVGGRPAGAPPAAAADAPGPARAPTKRSRAGLWLALLVLLGFGLAAGGAALWYFALGGAAILEEAWPAAASP